MPDSSGFFFTDGEKRDQLLFFDVATKKARVVVADTKAPGVVWPALSPDGKEIALMRVSGPKEKPNAQLVFFSPDGKELRKSKEFAVPFDPKSQPNKSVNDQPVFQLYWSAKPNKILISASGQAVIYDVATDNFIVTEGLLHTFGNSPFRPDGKGFLALQTPKAPPGGQPDLNFKPALFDWEGKAEEFKMSEQVPKADFGEGDLRPLILFFAPGMHRSRWEEGAAVSELGTLQLRYDLAKKVLDGKVIAGEKTADGKFVFNSETLAGGKVKVQVVDLGNPKKLDFGGKKDEAPKPDYRLEIIKEGQKPVVVREDLDFCNLMLSPDGKYVAVSCLLPSPPNAGLGRAVLLVVDSRGEVIFNRTMADMKK